jgi:hypothetical protein
MCLEYPKDGEEEGHASGTTLSSSTKTTSGKSGKKSDLKKGQHGRHKVHKKVHAIYKIRPHGEPLEPETIISVFSNQCSCIVREHVPITCLNWRKFSDDLKGALWGDVLRRFEYPPDSIMKICARGMRCILRAKRFIT